MSNTLSRAALSALVLLFGGCAFQPPGETPVESSYRTDYRQWFHETEACAGKIGDFDSIYWIEADLEPGLYGHTEGNTVWIDRDYVGNRRVVAHEMLHILLHGDPHHTDAAWTACHLWGPQ